MTAARPFFTLRWRAPAGLEILDQRELPRTERYVTLHDARETADAIRSLAIRGAPAIGCAAAYGIALEAALHAGAERPAFDAALERAFAVLAASRPTAVNLFWALDRMRRVLTDHIDTSPTELADALRTEAHRIVEEDVAANVRMGEYGAKLVPDGASVLTHCNAGALATAGHGTALGVVRSAVASGKRVHVYADETRPVLQGARLTAWELRRDGIPVTVLPDGASGHLMRTRRIDLVVVGADRVAANGDVANKIGTYNLAVLAHRHGVPFYVACPRSTFDVGLDDGSAIPIEERSPSEVTGFGSEVWTPANVDVFNPAFDVTPAELVTAIITEDGVIERPDRDRVEAMLAG
ncbi:MAG: S-methyl-5-thioribose-1-phosphate isomerase [Betaproteobacteria bacterium]|nr:S-methyl-5-thioribose-1-phosphate isomerase [Betaproteobacteria bacterium]